MISSNTLQQHTSHPSITDPRIKAAAKLCAQKIKKSTELHNANIEAAYQEFREAVAQIESEDS